MAWSLMITIYFPLSVDELVFPYSKIVESSSEIPHSIYSGPLLFSCSSLGQFYSITTGQPSKVLSNIAAWVSLRIIMRKSYLISFLPLYAWQMDLSVLTLVELNIAHSIWGHDVYVQYGFDLYLAAQHLASMRCYRITASAEVYSTATCILIGYISLTLPVLLT